MKKWHGILKITEIEHIRNSKVIWKQENVYNQLHLEGEAFLLSCCFNNDGSYPPSEYYFGLDNRSSVTGGDTISEIVGEPTGNGYSRQSRSSSGGFTIELFNGSYRASSGVMSFSASGGSWGPVRNIFVTNSGGSGILIATAALTQELTLIDGDSVNLRMALALS